MGMQSTTVHSCISRLLLVPTPAMMEFIKPRLRAVRDPDALTIGIHLRTGFADPSEIEEEGMSHADGFPTLVEQSMACARDLEAKWLGTRRKVVWVLVSEHPDVPSLAKPNFGAAQGVTDAGRAYERDLIMTRKEEGKVSGLHTGPDFYTTVKSQMGGPASNTSFPTYESALREAWADW